MTPRIRSTIAAALLVVAPLLAVHGALAADCRSNTECIPPVTTASIAGTPGENGWWRSNVVATLVCTDNTGCSGTQYSIDGSTFSTYTGPFPVTGDGLHFLVAGSEDQAGNKENPELIVVRIDTGAPSVSLVSPLAGNVYANGAEDPVPAALPATIVAGTTEVQAAIADAVSGPGSARSTSTASSAGPRPRRRSRCSGPPATRRRGRTRSP